MELAGKRTDVISGTSYRGTVALADLLGGYPVALLVR